MENVSRELRQSTSQLVGHLKQRSADVQNQATQTTAANRLREELELIHLSLADGDNQWLRHLRDTGEAVDGERTPLLNSTDHDLPGSAGLYEAKFREAGLDLATTDIDEAAGWIRASTIRGSLVTALDNWARLLPNRPADATMSFADADVGPPTEHNSSSRVISRVKLLAIADAAEPSPWRRTLRAALATGDVDTLVQLTQDDEVFEQTPARIAWLGASLRQADQLQLY